MSRITITLHIDIPDGAKIATPDVDYRDTAPIFEPPLPDAPPPDLFQEAQRVFPGATVHSGPASTPNCPDGHGAMKYVPGGTSKRTGKQYDAFYGCNDRDCKRTAQAA